MPPHILQIHRERVKRGCEAEYETIEGETGRLCIELGCPHPFLGIVSLAGPTEVWFFNGYDSLAEQRQVVDDYVRNTALFDALTKQSQQKARLTETPVEVVATYRADASRGEPWSLGQGRFLVITVTKDTSDVAGTVFEAPDGTRFVFRAAQSRSEADDIAWSAGPESVVCGVRPNWSFPAPEWVARDPAFWR